MKRFISFAMCSLALACAGKDENNDGIADGVRTPGTVTAVAPSQAVGSISGQTVNSKLQPLADVAITLILGKPGEGSSYKTTSDAEGNFSIRNLPAPSGGQLIFSLPGHGLVRTTVNIGATAGQYPVNDANSNVGQVGLFKLDSTITLQVVTALGRPATGAKAFLEMSPAGFTTSGGTYGNGQGVVAVEGTVDANGNLAFAQVPTLTEVARIGSISFTPTIAVSIAGLDENGDGRIDFNGTTTTLSINSLIQQNQAPIILADARTAGALAIAASNLGTLLTTANTAPLRNIIKESDKIYVAFSQPILPATLKVTVTEENCATVVATSTELKGGDTLLSISPSAAWAAGKEYNIAVRATGLDNGGTVGRVGFFFVGDVKTPQPVDATPQFRVRKATANTMMDRVQPGDTVYAVFDKPIRNLSTTSAKVFVNFDLNGNGTIGTGMTDTGELGNANTAIVITADEWVSDAMTGTFACTASGYTTRFRIDNLAIPVSGIPLGTQIRVVLPKDTAGTAGYQTVWGQVTIGDFNGTMSSISQG